MSKWKVVAVHRLLDRALKYKDELPREVRVPLKEAHYELKQKDK